MRRGEPKVEVRGLPLTTAKLYGRETELSWLDACWDERVHVAVIVAWGGVVKTALVTRWLASRRDRGWDGAAHVFAWSFYNQGTQRQGSSDEFMEAALRSFGDPDPSQGSSGAKGERLAELVKKKRTLLVLDGLEPLQGRPEGRERWGKLQDPALEALLGSLGWKNAGLCLITSRVAVAELVTVGGEKVQVRDLSDLSPEAGAELLRDRGVKGTEEELREVVAAYRGHALALTLLGSYLEAAAGGDIRQWKELGPLTAGEGLGEHARRVMMAYQRWLGKVENAILNMIGLFDRPATAPEIEALRAGPVVLGLTDALLSVDGRGWREAVAKLRRFGLLSTEHDARGEVLDAHPLVREYFGEQFRREHHDAWREGHRRLYRHHRRRAKELPETNAEMMPLYAAVTHGCLAGKEREVLDEVWWKRIERGDEYFNLRKLGAFGSEVAVLANYFDPPWERLAPGLELGERDQAIVLNAAGFALRGLGRLPEAAALMRQSLDQCVVQGDWAEAAIRASNLGEILQVRGDLREAIALARKSVDYADRSSDAFWRLYARTTLGAALHAMGLRDEAVAQFEEAERVQKREIEQIRLRPLPSQEANIARSPLVFYATKNGVGKSMALHAGAWALAGAALRSSDSPRAPARRQSSLDAPFHPLLYALQGFRYCDVLLDRGRYADVRDRAQEALKIAERDHLLLDIALNHLLLGRTQLLTIQSGATGDLAQASLHLERALESLRRYGGREWLPLGLLARAALHTHTRDFDLAHRDLAEVAALAVRCGFRLLEADAQLGLAHLRLAEENPTQALAHVTTGRGLIEETGYHRRDEDLVELEAKAREMVRAAPPRALSPSVPPPAAPPVARVEVDAACAIGLLRDGPIDPDGKTTTPPGKPVPAALARLDGSEVLGLVKALLSAFPSRSALAQMLRYHLDMNLDEIAGPVGLSDTVFELVRHAEAQGGVSAVLDAALKANPENPDLLALAAKRRA